MINTMKTETKIKTQTNLTMIRIYYMFFFKCTAVFFKTYKA